MTVVKTKYKWESSSLSDDDEMATRNDHNHHGLLLLLLVLMRDFQRFPYMLPLVLSILRTKSCLRNEIIRVENLHRPYLLIVSSTKRLHSSCFVTSPAITCTSVAPLVIARSATRSSRFSLRATITKRAPRFAY